MSKKSRRGSVTGLGLALGALLVACVAGFTWIAFSALQRDTGAERKSAKAAKQSAHASADQAPADQAPADQELVGRQAGESTQRGLATKSRPEPQAEDLPALKQRLRGVSLQLENRERSQALVDEALASDNLSADERLALEARNDKMITKLAAYHQQVAQLQERIRTLEVSR